MTRAAGIAIVTGIVTSGAMLFEALHSSRNERELRARGAVEPPDDVFRVMQLVYPAAFLALAIEGGLGPGAANRVLGAGVVVLVGAKSLKYWAISALGQRWSFRVLTLAGAPLVTSGPYRLMRHPNYLAVIGELLGLSLVVGAPIAGAVALLIFGAILGRRVAVEERALDSASGVGA